ncbi:MAG: carbohydrate binding domain-containing protein [Nocardioidaceae bacterium]
MNHRTNRPTHRMQQRPLSPARGRHPDVPRALARSGPRRSAQRWLTLTSVALASLLAVPAAMAVSNHVSRDATTSATLASDLVVNGGFERGVDGWRTNRKSQSLTIVTPGAAGTRAVKATNSVVGNVIVNDKVNTVTTTKANQVYDVTATVRSTGAYVSGALTVRETGAAGLVSRTQKAFYVNTTWMKVDLGFVSTVSGGQLDLNVLAWHVPVRTGLVVDAVHMTLRSPSPTPTPTTAPTTTSPTTSTTAPATTSTTSTTAPATTTSTTTTAPTTTSTTTTTTPSPKTCVSNRMGLPPSGQAYLGASAGGTQNYLTMEPRLGTTLPVHRTYYSANQVDAAVSKVKEDLAANRLPWLSFKLPYSWADMAAGRGDSWATDVVDRLAQVNGPVWLAFHHEPEGDGPIADWTDMQRHLAPIVHARSDNIAFTVIYISWDAFYVPQYALSNTWPGDQHVDILGLDMYNEYGAVRNGVLGTKMLEPSKYMTPASQFAQQHGVPWAVAEIGYTRAAASVDPDWLLKMFHAMQGNGGIGMSYFNSSLNSIADWTLADPVKFDAYKRLLPDSIRRC